MKHAGEKALAALAPLLDTIREICLLKERKTGVFCYKSRACLHFHEDPAGLFADLRPPGADDFDRYPVNTEAERAALVRILRKSLQPKDER